MNTKSKLIPKNLLLCWLCVLCLFVSPAAYSKNLNVQMVKQLTTDFAGNPIGYDWCWAASSKMILDFSGHPTPLTSIVKQGLGNSSYDAGNYGWGSGVEPANVAIYVAGGSPIHWVRTQKWVTLHFQGMREVIDSFSGGTIKAQGYARALTASEANAEINVYGEPFSLGIRWIDSYGTDVGGHAIVCYGYNSGTYSIHDPWFGSYLKSDAALRNGSAGTIATKANRWTSTVTAAKTLDILLLFDTSSHMSAAILSAKVGANVLLSTIQTKFKSFRVAVAEYRDFPLPPMACSPITLTRFVRLLPQVCWPLNSPSTN